MQWYTPFRRISSGTRFGHIPAALRCRRRHLAASPASGPGASASAGGAPALLGASASAGGAPALRGASAARASPRSSRAERKEDGAIRRMVCTCPFRPMVCTGCYTCLLFVLFGGWSLTHVSYLSFSADGLLHMSPICPFRRMVCSTCLKFVLFGGWSATHVFYLSFSADGLHRLLNMSPICPFRRMVCSTCLLFVPFGGWSVTHVSYLSFLADGLRGPYLSFWRLHILADGLHMLCFWRMVCIGHYTNGADPAPYIASGPIAYLIRWVVLVKPRHQNFLGSSVALAIKKGKGCTQARDKSTRATLAFRFPEDYLR